MYASSHFDAAAANIFGADSIFGTQESFYYLSARRGSLQEVSVPSLLQRTETLERYVKKVRKQEREPGVLYFDCGEPLCVLPQVLRLFSLESLELLKNKGPKLLAENASPCYHFMARDALEGSFDLDYKERNTVLGYGVDLMEFPIAIRAMAAFHIKSQGKVRLFDNQWVRCKTTWPATGGDVPIEFRMHKDKIEVRFPEHGGPARDVGLAIERLDIDEDDVD